MSVRVQQENFDVGAELAALSKGRTDIGAIVTFTGTVRATSEGVPISAPISAMTLEHYPGMTEAELARIEEEANARWPLLASLIVHRTGRLEPGENIVLVVTASAHRQAAFEAAEFLMDFLKTRAPFWKKESGPAGHGKWVDARECDTGASERWTRPHPSTHNH
jgi:molybdopterin synthase catalytic subunit